MTLPDGDENPAVRLAGHPRFAWRDGMRDHHGARCVGAGPALSDSGELGVPDLADDATAGILLGQLAADGTLTDVVRQDDEWIVAVDYGEGVEGYVGATMGEAAAWATLATWGEPIAS